MDERQWMRESEKQRICVREAVVVESQQMRVIDYCKSGSVRSYAMAVLWLRPKSDYAQYDRLLLYIVGLYANVRLQLSIHY